MTLEADGRFRQAAVGTLDGFGNAASDGAFVEKVVDGVAEGVSGDFVAETADDLRASLQICEYGFALDWWIRRRMSPTSRYGEMLGRCQRSFLGQWRRLHPIHHRIFSLQTCLLMYKQKAKLEASNATQEGLCRRTSDMLKVPALDSQAVVTSLVTPSPPPAQFFALRALYSHHQLPALSIVWPPAVPELLPFL